MVENFNIILHLHQWIDHPDRKKKISPWVDTHTKKKHILAAYKRPPQI